MNNSVALGDVDTIQELTNILVTDTASLLNVGSGLGDIFKIVTSDNQLILLGRRSFTADTFTHLDLESHLLTQKVADLDSVVGTIHNNVDGKVSIHITHLVLEALGDTSDHVVDNRANSTDSSNMLTSTVVDSEEKSVLVGKLDLNVQVTQVLGQSATGTSDSNETRLDTDFNTFRDSELVVLGNVLLLGISIFISALWVEVEFTFMVS